MLTTSVLLMADVGVQSKSASTVINEPYQTALRFVQTMGDHQQNHP